MKIAIVGTGISGMAAAWLLNRVHDITVYEAGGYVGGHSRTIDVMTEKGPVAVDTGFIVYNHRNYPNLVKLFETLGVETIPSDMSFGASIGDGWLEYGSKGLFSQKRNLLRPAFWGMLADILRFNKIALKFIEGKKDITLRRCLDDMGMGEWFRRYYLQAMGAAIWSCPAETVLDFPAWRFLQFFENHGLLTVNGHPQWRTVKGGSREYIARLTAPFRDKIHLNRGVVSLARQDGRIVLTDTTGHAESYDHVVLSCHADQALALMSDPDSEEREILGAFRYQKNRIVVHGDESFMPRHKGCWASWVYLSENLQDDRPALSLSYWMNRLQSLETDKTVIVTLNPGRQPRAGLVYDEHWFDHPVFTLETQSAQARMETIQGRSNLWHCGAYQRYGFHEDGLTSAIAVAEQLGAPVPWK